jgi:serine acetyltransferase
VIGAGAVVTKDVAPGSLVVGNPGRVIRTNLQTTDWGKITDSGRPVDKTAAHSPQPAASTAHSDAE